MFNFLTFKQSSVFVIELFKFFKLGIEINCQMWSCAFNTLYIMKIFMVIYLLKYTYLGELNTKSATTRVDIATI